MTRWLSLPVVLFLTASCFEITVPPDDHLKSSPDQVKNSSNQQNPTDNSDTVQPDATTTPGILSVDAVTDVSALFQDVPPQPCKTLCDCKPEFDCINDVCVESPPVQCCSHPLCDDKAPCWTKDGQKGTCDN